MAKSPTTPKPKKVKKTGRLTQMWRVFQMTRRYDKHITLLLLLSFFAPIVVSIVLTFVTGGGVFTAILWNLTGVMLGLLLLLIVLGRRAERAAYSQIEGEPGAVGAVVKNGLRGTWQGSETPVNVSPRTKDAVYRVVGKGGIVLIGEGPKARVQRMISDEERKIQRILPQIKISHIFVGPDEDSTSLWKLPSEIRKIETSLTRQEVRAVSNRLSSLQQNPVGIPKGIDPNRVRAPRPR